MLLAIVVAAVAGLVISIYIPASNQTTGQCNGGNGVMVIVLDENGVNGSVNKLRGSTSGHWPIIKVHKGDLVNILVCNLDKVSTHGFAIEHYFDAGRALLPGETLKVSFIAKDQGTYTIYCNVFCPIHAWMLSGELVVT